MQWRESAAPQKWQRIQQALNGEGKWAVAKHLIDNFRSDILVAVEA